MAEYDKYGRMKYDAQLHAKHGTPWTTADERYLIENYEAHGPEFVSLALERTIKTVMQRATELRRKKQMPKPSHKKHKRLRAL